MLIDFLKWTAVTAIGVGWPMVAANILASCEVRPLGGNREEHPMWAFFYDNRLIFYPVGFLMLCMFGGALIMVAIHFTR